MPTTLSAHAPAGCEPRCAVDFGRCAWTPDAPEECEVTALTPRGSDEEELEDLCHALRKLRSAFEQPYMALFTKYDDECAATLKMCHCTTFCVLTGLRDAGDCKRIVRATCALTTNSFGTDEIKLIFGYALTNLHKQYEYVCSLEAAERAELAVYHMYIAQALLFDENCSVKRFTEWCHTRPDEGVFLAQICRVMARWGHRMVVNFEAVLTAIQMFDDNLAA
jgi:hypothetical protein